MRMRIRQYVSGGVNIPNIIRYTYTISTTPGYNTVSDGMAFFSFF